MLVSNLTYALAEQLELPQDECYDYALAGLVHDIGKISLSPYLYGRNDDALDVEEMKYMRMHSKISFELLKPYGFSERVMQTVLHHHECYDGSGYPDNFSGKQIPMGARILKVADEFAALISERPYRKAFDIDTAVDIMIEEVKNMDMKIFITFQRMIHEEATLKLIQNSRISIDTDFQF